MDKMEELERLARVALKGRDWFPSDFGRGFLLREDAALIAAASPEVILRLVAIARAAKTYYERYAQDEAEDGAMLAKGWSEDRTYSGCSRQQAEDALALREALKDPQ